MSLLIRVFLGLAGLFLGLEGACNLVFWHGRTRLLFQGGRALRMTLGCVLVALAIGGA